MNPKQLLLQDILKSVHKFHSAFGVQDADKPTINTPEVADLRFKLMEEEIQEYLDAAKDGDLTEIADALGDILYVWAGTVLQHGLQDQIGPIFAEIQRSNMSKLGADGKPILNDGIIDPDKPIGKVLKGPNFSPPDIDNFL